MIEKGKIVLANLTFRTAKKKLFVGKQVIFSRPYLGEFQTKYRYDLFHDKYLLNRCGLKEDAELIKVDVIKVLGDVSKTINSVI